MSSFLTTQNALLALCRSFNSGATFTTTNSAAGDWSVLDSGSTYALVLTQAEDSLEAEEIDDYGLQGQRQERHTHAVHVCRAIGSGQGGVMAIEQDLMTTVEALKDYLRPFERQLSGARRMQIARTSAMQQTPAGEPSHLVQTIRIVVDCSLVVTW